MCTYNILFKEGTKKFICIYVHMHAYIFMNVCTPNKFY